MYSYKLHNLWQQPAETPHDQVSKLLQTTLHIDKARNMEDGTSHHRGIGKTQQHVPQEQENIVTCKQPKGM